MNMFILINLRNEFNELYSQQAFPCNLKKKTGSMRDLPMTLTTGYEITTAATNAVNAVITALMMLRLFHMNGPKIRRQVWGISFILFFAVCILGTIVHGIVLSEGTRTLLWDILYVILAFMIASFAVAVRYEIHGFSDVRKTALVCVLLSIVFLAVRTVLKNTAVPGFLPFTVYSGGMLLYLIIKILSARKAKPHLTLLLCAIFLLITGTVLQTVKQIRFHLIWDFNYNGVYHLFTLFFVLLTYVFVQRADRFDTAALMQSEE